MKNISKYFCLTRVPSTFSAFSTVAKKTAMMSTKLKDVWAKVQLTETSAPAKLAFTIDTRATGMQRPGTALAKGSDQSYLPKFSDSPEFTWREVLLKCQLSSYIK